MKTTICQFVITLLVLSSFQLQAQSIPLVDAQDKNVNLYIVRDGRGAEYKYFIDDKFIGQSRSKKYINTKVAPGKHLIWAKGENFNFLEAELEPGRAYLIQAKSQPEGVRLIPIGYDSKPYQIRRVKKLLANTKPLEPFPNDIPESLQEYNTALAKKAKKKYEQRIRDGRPIRKLNVPFIKPKQ